MKDIFQQKAYSLAKQCEKQLSVMMDIRGTILKSEEYPAVQFDSKGYFIGYDRFIAIGWIDNVWQLIDTGGNTYPWWSYLSLTDLCCIIDSIIEPIETKK